MFGWFSGKKKDGEAGKATPGTDAAPLTAESVPIVLQTQPVDVPNNETTPGKAREAGEKRASNDEAGSPSGSAPRAIARKLTAAGSTAAFAHLPSGVPPMAAFSGVSGPTFGATAAVEPATSLGTSESTEANSTQKKGFNFKKRQSAVHGKPPGSVSRPPASNLPMVPEGRGELKSDDLILPDVTGNDDSRSVVSTSGASSVSKFAPTRGGKPTTAPPDLVCKTCELMTHSHDFSTEDLVLSADVFTGWSVGDYVVVRQATPAATTESGTGTGRPRRGSTDSNDTAFSKGESSANLTAGRNRALLMQVTALVPSKGGSLQVSISNTTAEMAGFKNKQTIEVRRLSGKEEAESLFGLEHVEFSFRDQYCSKSGMWRFRKELVGSCVYLGQAVAGQGLRMQVRELSSGVDGTSIFLH
jgi:hypothetical protein